MCACVYLRAKETVWWGREGKRKEKYGKIWLNLIIEDNSV